VGRVLGGRAQHRGSADVDLLDDLVGRQALRDGLAERIEVHHHEVDGQHALRLHVSLVVGQFAPRQDAAVDLGVQRLHAATQHLGGAGEVGDLADRHALLRQQRLRPASGEQLDAQRGEPLGELDQAGLVGHRQQRARHLGHGAGA
jgi:hypothetical protein